MMCGVGQRRFPLKDARQRLVLLILSMGIKAEPAQMVEPVLATFENWLTGTNRRAVRYDVRSPKLCA
jgi:hypothetical protein